ncbi:MAG: polymer-forming cytoskeletal protein [Patescibacteria group bacterium]
MALFRDGNEAPNEVDTIIGPSVKVDGNFKSEGNITVNGVVQGSLRTNHDLRIGPMAKIKAEVSANNLFLEGEIRGNVTVKEKAQLKSTAKIFGNLETKVLSVEENAVINGKCTMLPEHAEELKQEMKKQPK